MQQRMTADDERITPGAWLADYELIQRLAVGGMAEIYLARSHGHGLSRLVALKCILPHLAEQPEFVRMFDDEARIAASLEHPNTVRVYDIATAGDRNYFIMDFVPGITALQLLQEMRRRRERLPLAHALTIAVGVAGALHHAHERTDATGRSLGIVHRDVSHSNVLIGHDGCVKLIDFGVAKCAAQQNLTVAGVLKGKVSYMSPEQCTGGGIDRRSDVFSMGTLLWEMTTGHKLFRGANDYEIMRGIVHRDAPSPRTCRLGYPRELEAIVLKALARDRAERYQTVAELEAALEEFAREHRIRTSTVALARFIEDVFPPGGEPPPARSQPTQRWSGVPLDLEHPTRLARGSNPRMPTVDLAADVDVDVDIDIDIDVAD